MNRINSDEKSELEAILTQRRVLYLTRNGMLEPLGQSQVLSYLKGLSKSYGISLISFEKQDDLSDYQAFESVVEDCKENRIRWLPQRFHYRPRIIAPAWDMLAFLFLCLREARKGNADLIHARSYIPAAVALLVYKLTRIPFIFDMRALWPEELITAKRLKRGSLIYRAIVWVERSCLKNAAAVVSLTDAAAYYLQEIYPEELQDQTVVVIPTCADLHRFVPQVSGREAKRPIYSCLGTVLSGWFRLEWLRAFIEQAAESDVNALFEIVTRDDPDEVRRRLNLDDNLNSRLNIFSMASQEVHQAIQQHTASVMFYAGGEISELGRSPTRMAEILGCGLPVVANSGVGDVARIVEKYRVGILVSEGSEQAMTHAIDQLEELRKDPELPARCRRAAEEVFSLESGTAAYDALYSKLVRS